MPTSRYEGILCRGVLNDVVADGRRNAVFAGFSRALRPNGVLILDAREWSASEQRKLHEPLFRKRVSTDRGELTFTSVTEIDPDKRQLLMSERHALRHESGEHVSDHQFVMRCWEFHDLSAMLARYGFEDVLYFGAYDPRVEVGATDRIVAIAQRSGVASQ